MMLRDIVSACRQQQAVRMMRRTTSQLMGGVARLTTTTAAIQRHQPPPPAASVMTTRMTASRRRLFSPKMSVEASPVVYSPNNKGNTASNNASFVFVSRPFSSEAAVAVEATEETTKPNKTKRTKIKDRNPIILTDRAAERIKQLLQNQPDTVLGLRLGVKRRGCNGLSYTMNYANSDDKSTSKDILMESHNIKVYIEPMALFNVVGTVMDWEETEMSSEFTFQNPNSKGECGCGESFNV